MSAKAHLHGMFPPGSGPKFEFEDNYKRVAAIPPYYVGGKNHIVKDVSAIPNYSPNEIPILRSYDFMLRAYHTDVCPKMVDLHKDGFE